METKGTNFRRRGFMSNVVSAQGLWVESIGNGMCQMWRIWNVRGMPQVWGRVWIGFEDLSRGSGGGFSGLPL